MKIPKKMAILGQAEFLDWKPKGARRAKQISFQTELYYIGCNSTGSILYIIPATNETVFAQNVNQNNSWETMLNTWVGHDCKKDYSRIQIPKIELKRIGQAEQIRYNADFWPGEPTIWDHTFSGKASLYAERMRNPRFFAVKKTKGIFVNEMGLV